MPKHKKMNRVINSVGMVLFAIIIIGTAAASTVLDLSNQLYMPELTYTEKA
jgi:hypothetical protein